VTEGCEASVPLLAVEGEVSGRATVWAQCGATVTAVHTFRCPNGHHRVGRTCADHPPEPGRVGCSQCFAATGAEVTMTAEVLLDACPHPDWGYDDRGNHWCLTCPLRHDFPHEPGQDPADCDEESPDD
jgi:hypothetical protein